MNEIDEAALTTGDSPLVEAQGRWILEEPSEPLLDRRQWALMEFSSPITTSTPPSDRIPLCDLPVLLERPFFALAKQRQSPIRYLSPNKRFHLNVEPLSNHGIATIYDADTLTAIISLAYQRAHHMNEPLEVSARQLLAATKQGEGGRQYHLLKMALTRLSGTLITTNISPTGKDPGEVRSFRFIEHWDETTSRGLKITISPWIAEGIKAKRLLPINPDYMTLTGAFERFLYRTARKHAGGHGSEGWSFSTKTLHLKSGTLASYASFRSHIKKAVRGDRIPDFSFDMTQFDAKKSVITMRAANGPMYGKAAYDMELCI